MHHDTVTHAVAQEGCLWFLKGSVLPSLHHVLPGFCDPMEDLYKYILPGSCLLGKLEPVQSLRAFLYTLWGSGGAL